MKAIKFLFTAFVAIFSGIPVATKLHSEIKQEVFLCNGLIKDGKTNKPLQNVSIYAENDTIIGTKSNGKGEFQINVPLGTNLYVKKVGYIWEILKVENKNKQCISLWKSVYQPFIGKDGRDQTDMVDEVVYDGRIVPKEEWNGINRNYIDNIILMTSELDGRVKIVIISKQNEE